jgi:hypothetical protein
MQRLAFNAPTVVVVFIVYASIGLIHDWIFLSVLEKKEELPMKIKTSIVCLKSVLFSVWTMGANFLAGALLT